MKTIKTGVIYARFSSDNQRDESIDAQIRACKEYAERSEIELVDIIYTDRAKSATSDRRPEFQQMIKDAEKGKFDCIIVHKLDRFSRNKYDSAMYKSKLKKYGVQLISVTEKLDGSPESIILESVIEGMAEYYSANLGREVRKGMKETALQAKHTGGMPPLGYDVGTDKKYKINPQEAVVVREIFHKYLEGYGYNLILEYLKEKGHKTKAGKDFSKRALYDILKNEKYSGVYIFKPNAKVKRYGTQANDEVIRIDGGMPAIISREEFVKVQETLENNKLLAGSNKAKEQYLLTGIAVCGECGSSLQGNSRKSGRNKLPYKTYRCNCRANNKTCKNKEIRKEYLEEFVLHNLEQRVLNEEIVPSLVKQINEQIRIQNEKDKEAVAIYYGRIERINKQIEKIVNAISEGIDARVFKGKLETLQAEKQEINETIYRIESTQCDVKLKNITEQDVLQIIKQVKDAVLNRNIPESKKFIRDYIKKVEVFNDHVEVTFNMAFYLGKYIELIKVAKISRDELNCKL